MQRRPKGRKGLVGERGRYNDTRRAEKAQMGKARAES